MTTIDKNRHSVTLLQVANPQTWKIRLRAIRNRQKSGLLHRRLMPNIDILH